MSDEREARAALAFLTEQPDFFETKGGHSYATAGTNLERVHRLLDLLERPERAYRATIVAGTKGKGSTASATAAIARAAGKRVGLYTQPHLHVFRERIVVDGELISPDTLIATVERVRPAVERYRATLATEMGDITAYEIQTAAALVAFQLEGVDLAVLEVGLGGRLDAVNAVAADVVAITAIGMDHMRVLGSTIEAIATEKAAVIKSAGVAVSAPQVPDAAVVIDRRASEQGSRLVVVGRDVPDGRVLDPFRAETRRQVVELSFRGEAVLAEASLLGAHQATNLQVAATLAGELLGPALTADAVRSGCEAVSWAGRFEIVGEEPPVVIDGAHNGESAAALVRALGDIFPGRRVRLIISVFTDKDIAAIVAALAPVATDVVATRAEHPRAAPAEVVAAALEQHGRVARIAPSVADALEQERAAAQPGDVIVVTGSLTTVGEARRALELPGSELAW